MTVEARPSDILKQDADTVTAGSRDTVRVTVGERKIPADPIVEGLRQATTYALYNTCGRPTSRVNERVISPADRAAVRFARALLDARRHLDPDPQPRNGTGTTPHTRTRTWSTVPAYSIAPATGVSAAG